MAQGEAHKPKRTAVLVVHGMGSQRPLDTVRGVVDAVWLEGDLSARGERRIWTHPERSGVDDIDLPVITTNFLPETADLQVDFHELYWAHLMSETRAVAVLLWLFELARMGPRLKPSIQPLYWSALVFLSALMLSVSLLIVQLVIQFAELVATNAEVTDASPPRSILYENDVHSLVYVFLVSILVIATFALFAAIGNRAFKLATWSFALSGAAALLFYLVSTHEIAVEALTRILLPLVIAAVVVKVTMGWWGIVGLGIAVLLSVSALGFVIVLPGFEFSLASIPWSVTSFWSSLAACYFIALYLALYASFLQPYLGDAARYFRNSPGNVAVRRKIRRQAVNTLEALHLSGDYDRIVVVAHSLGAVVAYDMLRAYYSRINEVLPDCSKLGSDFDEVDRGTLGKSAAREKGRRVISEIARIVDAAGQRVKLDHPEPGDAALRAWLVTDFVTLGSPLTHALYLMCRGNNESELRADFQRRVREREFPTCPPQLINGDRRLTFDSPNTHKPIFHHGGLFALTRWTNLYFPASQLLWGDAIGGEVGAIFGDPNGSNIADVPVHTNKDKRDSFFAHILYWDLKYGITAPHIVALKKAIDLPDKG